MMSKGKTALGHDDVRSKEETVDSLRLERDDALQREYIMKEQLEVLAEATQLLTRLVTSPIKTAPPDGSEVGDGEIQREEELLKDLHDALGDRRLKATGFPALFNGCEMLRESLRLTAIEADDALDDARAANEATALVDSRLRAASKALGKLYKENSKLKMERKTLAREVNEFVGELNNEKDRQVNEAYALMAHEQVLSPMSVSTKMTESLICEDDTLSGVLSFPSPSPAKTLVTEGGAATVRFSPIDDDASTSSVGFTQEGLAISQLGRGGSFQKGDVDDGSIPIGDAIGRMMNRSNVDRGVYHIDFFSKNIGIKLRAIPARPKLDGKRRNKRADIPPLSPLTPISPMSANMTKPTPGKPSKRAFIVSGFRNYDLSLDKRPELGARLVAVDGTSLEYGKWTLKAVCDKIRTREGGVRLSFRNDVLSQHDIAYLNKILSTKTDIEGEKTEQSNNIGEEVEQEHHAERIAYSPNSQQTASFGLETPTEQSTPTASLEGATPETPMDVIPITPMDETPKTPMDQSITIQDYQGRWSPVGFAGRFRLPYRHRRNLTEGMMPRENTDFPLDKSEITK